MSAVPPQSKTIFLHASVYALCSRCPSDSPIAPAAVRRFSIPCRCARSDGWSEARQCGFLAHLYSTGSVVAAAREVGMTRASVYRLRAREGAESFALAWDRVLMPPGSGRCAAAKRDWRKVTTETLRRRFQSELVQPVIYRGRMTMILRKPDDSALLRLLRRGACARGTRGPTSAK